MSSGKVILPPPRGKIVALPPDQRGKGPREHEETERPPPTEKMMMEPDDRQPIVTTQTVATNEPVETVLSRYREKEIIIPSYQRDAEEWGEEKKSLFIESILNRLTVPSFYLAPDLERADRFEVVDGQQRLTTLTQFYENRFALLPEAKCSYFGNATHYAGRRYEELGEDWRRVFRRYLLTMVSLPTGISLDLRLEVFRRINEGGTPLSGQDIRLGYYSESPRVRFIQLVGVYDPHRIGARRMIANAPTGTGWLWEKHSDAAIAWKEWWEGKQTAHGQTASEMFLWFLVLQCRSSIDRLLGDKKHLQDNLRLTFRNSNEEALDIICAQLRFEDLSSVPPLLPTLDDLKNKHFQQFRSWFSRVLYHCPDVSNAGRYRPMALLLASLNEVFGDEELSRRQWDLVKSFLKSSRSTAESLSVQIPESKGRWTSSQRAALDAMIELARAIRRHT